MPPSALVFIFRHIVQPLLELLLDHFMLIFPDRAPSLSTSPGPTILIALAPVAEAAVETLGKLNGSSCHRLSFSDSFWFGSNDGSTTLPAVARREVDEEEPPVVGAEPACTWSRNLWFLDGRLFAHHPACRFPRVWFLFKRQCRHRSPTIFKLGFTASRTCRIFPSVSSTTHPSFMSGQERKIRPLAKDGAKPPSLCHFFILT